jgi:hypothetical protein
MSAPLPLLSITLARGDTWAFVAEYDEAEVSVYALHTYALHERRGLIGRAADMSEALDVALAFADELYQIDWEDHSDTDRYVPADHDYHDPNIYSGSEWAGAQEGRRA